MPANFNSIARVYDVLSKMVFGNTIKKSQIEMLNYIPANSRILIVGGGTGWILEEICKVHSSGLHIIYVDNSSKMIQLSEKRNIENNTIIFIATAIEKFKLSEKFDLVMTPFLLDMFCQTTCDKIAQSLHESLNLGGLWFYIDFHLSEKKPFWQRVFLRIMYYFFRFSCKIETTQLPKTERYFLTYSLITEKTYNSNFIISRIYKKDI